MDIMYAAVDSRKVKCMTHTESHLPQYFTLLFCFGKIKTKNRRPELTFCRQRCDRFVCSVRVTS